MTEQKIKLITLGSRVAPQGGVGLVAIPDYFEAITCIEDGLILLRCGCTATQFSLREEYCKQLGAADSSRNSNSAMTDRITEHLTEIINRFAVPGETLTLSSLAYDAKHAVATVTRSTEPKTEEVPFGSLKKGDEFFDDEGDRARVIASGWNDHAGNLVVFLDGVYRNITSSFNRNEIVKKIIS